MRRYVFVVPAALLILTLVVVGAFAFLAWRDDAATARCHRIGGQTYDSGQHCIIGGKTVSTR